MIWLKVSIGSKRLWSRVSLESLSCERWHTSWHNKLFEWVYFFSHFKYALYSSNVTISDRKCNMLLMLLMERQHDLTTLAWNLETDYKSHIHIISSVTWVTYVTSLNVFPHLKFRGNICLMENVWYNTWCIIGAQKILPFIQRIVLPSLFCAAMS